MQIQNRGAKLRLASSGPVAPGQAVNVTIRVIGGRKDLPIQGGTVGLVWRTYKTSSGDWANTVSHKDRRHGPTVPFIGAGTVAAGSTFDQTVTLMVPADAPPSAAADYWYEDQHERGDGAEWLAVAKLDGGHLHQPEGQVVVEVLASRAAGAVDETAEPITKGDVGLMSLQAVERHGRPGDVLRGTVTLHPPSPVTVQEVKVGLQRAFRPVANSGLAWDWGGAMQSVAAAFTVGSGEVRSIPFEVQVPDKITFPTVQPGDLHRWVLAARAVVEGHTQALEVWLPVNIHHVD